MDASVGHLGRVADAALRAAENYRVGDSPVRRTTQVPDRLAAGCGGLCSYE